MPVSDVFWLSKQAYRTILKRTVNLYLKNQCPCFDVGPMARRKAFTLVEILIVVSILGILAAIVIPQYSSATIKAKEATAKEILQTLRGQIELYTISHNGFPPGYINGSESASAGVSMIMQLKFYTNIQSVWSSIKSAEYCYGPYIKQLPKNPFSGSWSVYALRKDPGNGDWPAANESSYGWLYYPSTKAIRLNTFGNDSDGKPFQSY